MRRLIEKGLHKCLPKNPNVLTISALAIALSSLPFSAFHIAEPLIPLLLALAGIVDIIDGLIARFYKRSTPLGAFLDSVMDRYVDFIAIADMWLLSTRSSLNSILALTLLMGSLMTSYARARAESLGISLLGRGLLERSERYPAFIAVIIAYFALGQHALTIGMAVLAVLTNLTAVERIVTTIRLLRMGSNKP